MGESLADVLVKCADGLRWLGKYTESNALILLARLLRAHEIGDLEQLEAWVQREEEATRDPRDAEIARLREEVERVTRHAVALVSSSACEEHSRHARSLTFSEFAAEEHGVCWRCLRAQLAAAQADRNTEAGWRYELRVQLERAVADNVSLRRAIEQTIADYHARALIDGVIVARLTKALATPAPGTPLLDAVRALLAAAQSWHDQLCLGVEEHPSPEPCCATGHTLATVRALLPPVPTEPKEDARG